MADLKFDIDIQELSSGFKKLQEEVKKDLIDAIGNLAPMTHAKAMELASEQLTSTASTYKDALGWQRLDETTWLVTLDEKALWIEDGRKSGFMSELLHGKSSKVNKDGKRYAVIPFEHSKKPTEQSPSARGLTSQIKEFLHTKNIPYKKLELNSDGSPRTGLLHRFNIDSARLKDSHKDPPLKGLAIYQNKQKDGSVRRDVMTFRIITEDSEKEGRWVHPGREPKLFMDKALDWAVQEWETKILPEVLDKYK